MIMSHAGDTKKANSFRKSIGLFFRKICRYLLFSYKAINILDKYDEAENPEAIKTKTNTKTENQRNTTVGLPLEAQDAEGKIFWKKTKC